ncbi:hypothetical protein [Bradyrhizobium sp. BR 10289]|uniref:hypothetical protein n=1 Tax=Bradyrhizobium sp. BR 10289 TaxID=2749993 RepID=UPI001C649CF2|nr:hypothetical protein [Bradyrhizobium sp. BR 10289]MBW7971200.1 hypothetical protein [Bradyrhizobium sp. BR 10289]
MNLSLPALLSSAADAGQRPRLLADIACAFPELRVEQIAAGSPAAVGEMEAPHLHGRRRHVGDGYKVVALASDGSPSRAGIQLPNGTIIASYVERGRH